MESRTDEENRHCSGTHGHEERDDMALTDNMLKNEERQGFMKPENQIELYHRAEPCLTRHLGERKGHD